MKNAPFRKYLVIFAVLLAARGGLAETLKGVILESGIMEAVSKEKVTTTPETSSGVTRTVKQSVVVEQTDNIPVKMGIRFGFRYLVTGLPDTNEVSFTKIVTHPPMRKDDGSISTGFKFKESFRPMRGMVSSFTGYGFDHDYELLTGDWKIELWYGDTKLIEKTYHVVPLEKQ